MWAEYDAQDPSLVFVRMERSLIAIVVLSLWTFLDIQDLVYRFVSCRTVTYITYSFH